MTVGASRNGRQGDRRIPWRLPHLRSRHQRGGSARCRDMAGRCGCRIERWRAAVGRRERCVEASLSGVPRSRLSGAGGRVDAPQQRASRHRAALQHGDGARRTAGLESQQHICCSAGCTINPESSSTRPLHRSCRRWRQRCREIDSGSRHGWSIAPTRCSRGSS